MRFPVRWRIRTLLLAILVAGLVAGGVALKRRAERLARIGQEYELGEEILNKIIQALDDVIEVERGTIEMDLGDVELEENLRSTLRPAALARAREKLEADRMELERHLAVRSKFLELQEYARQEARRYAEAARQPWNLVSAGEPIGPRAEALTAEFFQGVEK